MSKTSIINSWCKTFGHRAVGNKYKDSCHHRYFKIVETETDGLGVKHARLFSECSRCGEDFYIGSVHLPAKNDPAYAHIHLETLLLKCLRLTDYLCETYDERTSTYSMRKIEGDLRKIDPVKLSKEISKTILE